MYTEHGKGKHAGDGMDKYLPERDRLETPFVKYSADAVFSGHEHLYARRTVHGIAYIITGSGGAPLYADDRDGDFYHFIIMTVDGDTVGAEAVDINRKVRDRF